MVCALAHLSGSEHDRDPDVLAESLKASAPAGWWLDMITNRGVKVWPDGLPETYRTDHWRCRFVHDDAPTTFTNVLDLLGGLDRGGFEVIKTEHLYTFDDVPAYSLGQGQ